MQMRASYLCSSEFIRGSFFCSGRRLGQMIVNAGPPWHSCTASRGGLILGSSFGGAFGSGSKDAENEMATNERCGIFRDPHDTVVAGFTGAHRCCGSAKIWDRYDA